MIQHLIVGLIVFAAVLYSLWLLMPAAARRAVSVRLASLARRCGLGEQEAERLQATLATHSSCGECESCKGCAAAPMTEQRGLVTPRGR
jgi:4-amino-4-deoxy-L-arabinose transferase-like glycosyltransferase